MRASVASLAVLATVALGQAATAQGTATVTHTVLIRTGTDAGPGFRTAGPSYPNVAAVAKVVEVEPDVVEVAPFPGAPKERMLRYKVAILKIDDPLIGASGITRVRVGFPADASTSPGDGGSGRPRAITASVMIGPAVTGTALSAGMEGCFSLAKHANADFYVLSGPPIQKSHPSFAKEVDRLKKYARAVNDPVAALKAKDLDERFEAAQIILQSYLTPRGSNVREPVPEEENKLLVALLTELPWVPKDGNRVRADGRLVPHREVLWYRINPGEFGFKRPEMPKRTPGDPPPDMNKLMDEASTKFLKENGDKIKIKRYVAK
jgi:hypothetical protein